MPRAAGCVVALCLTAALSGLLDAKAVKRRFNVTRVYADGDFFTDLLRADCGADACRRFNATSQPSDACRCRCPADMPVFLNERGCASSISECGRVLMFGARDRSARVAPTIFLPLRGQILNADAPLDWKAAGVEADESGAVDCELVEAAFLGDNGWRPLDLALFALFVANRNTFLQWRGNGAYRRFLEGKLVQMSIGCANETAPTRCALFRVLGTDAMLGARPLGDGRAAASQPSRSAGDADDWNEYGVVVGVVSAVLLVLTVLTASVLWIICWRQQKDRLKHKIHMQLLYQQHIHQNGGVYHQSSGMYYPPHPASMQETAFSQQMSARSLAPPRPDAAGRDYYVAERVPAELQLAPLAQPEMCSSAPYGLNGKRKLFFSAEFFEPELMVDPPPVAEEFLYEVRRMIDMAKHRIRSRRYTPALDDILEERAALRRDDALDVEAQMDDLAGDRGSPSSEGSGDSAARNPTPPSDDSNESLGHDSGLGDSGRVDRSPDTATDWLQLPDKPPRHSRLFRNFAARQQQQPGPVALTVNGEPPVEPADWVAGRPYANGCASPLVTRKSLDVPSLPRQFARRPPSRSVFPAESPFSHGLPARSAPPLVIAAASPSQNRY